MGQYASVFMTPPGKAVSKVTNPNKSNWITVHAIAAELSIAEVERLWVRFQQLGCTKTGELTEELIQKSEYGKDVFVRNILKKYADNTTKKISFQNFLRALKWVEQAGLDEKIRGIFNVLNGGSPVTADLMMKILERVYANDKGPEVQRIAGLFFQMMDRDGKGQIEEHEFVQGIKTIPTDMLEHILNFQILPDEMKGRLHKDLQEFRSDNITPVSAPQRAQSLQPQTPQIVQPKAEIPPHVKMTPRQARRVPPDNALREVSNKVYKKDWPRLANKLGFYLDDVEDIKNAYPNNPQHQTYQMLKEWRNKNGEEATNEVLEKGLLDCAMNDAAALLANY